MDAGHASKKFAWTPAMRHKSSHGSRNMQTQNWMDGASCGHWKWCAGRPGRLAGHGSANIWGGGRRIAGTQLGFPRV